MDQIPTFLTGAATALVAAWIVRRWQKSDTLQSREIANLVEIQRRLLEVRVLWERYYGPESSLPTWPYETTRKQTYEQFMRAIDEARALSMALPPSPAKRELLQLWELITTQLPKENLYTSTTFPRAITRVIDNCAEYLERRAAS